MNANPKFIRLLRGLLDATQKGEVRWEQTISEKDFRVQLEGGMVRVGEVIRSETDDDDEGALTPYATLIGRGGKTLEFAWPEDLAPENLDMIKELYEAVRRQVLQVDDILDRLIQQVESGKTAWKAS
jgi:hypothetical protein